MACQRSTSLRLCACRLGRAQSSEAGDAGAPPRQPQPALPLIPAPAPAPSRRLQPLPRSAGRWRSRHTVAVGGVASARAHLVGEERHGIALLVLRRLRRPERRQQHQRDESQRRPQTPRRHGLDCPEETMGTRSVFVLILRASAAMEDEEVAFRVRPRPAAAARSVG
jgi:hypothetical protein